MPWRKPTKRSARVLILKEASSRMDWDKKEVVTLYSDDDQKLKSVIDILQSKLVKRGVSSSARLPEN